MEHRLIAHIAPPNGLKRMPKDILFLLGGLFALTLAAAASPLLGVFTASSGLLLAILLLTNPIQRLGLSRRLTAAAFAIIVLVMLLVSGIHLVCNSSLFPTPGFSGHPEPPEDLRRGG